MKGTCIGPYHLLDVLGQGGMGTVYLADQKEPVRRRVAVKVIKLGMDSKEVLARFHAERQALAMMEHSSIAKVFDGGITDEGRPYFVMEYVRGEPITAYCDTYRLSLADRLALFQQVCGGVQHAHQKGVIHRDLKPGNILVSHHEGDPVPKIIDFGLARATDHRLVENTIYTELGQIIGTPEYMAPEQADFNNVDIDTRADVYALGVLLYELLVGDLPFPSAHLRKQGLMEIQRIIREDDPPKPSSRVSTLHGDSAAAAKARRTEPRAWLRTLRGDLDWIVLRAMEKAPARRYQTAQALAEDVDRSLRDEPVEARPPSVAYRLRKTVRKHRAMVLTTSLVAVSLLVGLVAFAVENQRARRSARDATNASARFREEKIRADAAAEAARASAADAAQNAREAQDAARRATGRRLLADARDVLDTDPKLSLMLAIEAAERVPGLESNQALLEALARPGSRALDLPAGEPLFSPDSRWLVLRQEDRFSVWSVDPWEEDFSYAPEAEVSGQLIAFSPDSRRLLLIQDDEDAGWQLTVWPVGGWRAERTMALPGIVDVDEGFLDPTGRYLLATAPHEALTVVRVADGSVVSALDSQHPSFDLNARWLPGRSAVWLPHPRAAWVPESGPDSPEPLIVDPLTAAGVDPIEVFEGRTAIDSKGVRYAVFPNPDDNFTAAIHDLTGEAPAIPFAVDQGDPWTAVHATFGPDGRFLLATGSIPAAEEDDTEELRVFEAASGRCVGRLPIEDSLAIEELEDGSPFAVGPPGSARAILALDSLEADSATIFVIRLDKALQWEPDEWVEGVIERLAITGDLNSARFSGPTRLVGLAEDGRTTAFACDLPTLRVVRILGPTTVWDAELSPDGRWLLTDMPRAVDAPRPSEALRAHPCFEPAELIDLQAVDSISPDLRYVARAWQGRSWVEDLHTGRLPLSLPTSAIRQVISPDGQALAVIPWGDDTFGELWGDPDPSTTIAGRLLRVADGSAVAELELDAVGIRSLSFTTDSRSLVACDFRGVLHTWDVATGRRSTGRLEGGEVLAARFSESDEIIITIDGQHTLTEWQLTTGRRIRSAKTQVSRWPGFTREAFLSPEDAWARPYLERRLRPFQVSQQLHPPGTTVEMFDERGDSLWSRRFPDLFPRPLIASDGGRTLAFMPTAYHGQIVLRSEGRPLLVRTGGVPPADAPPERWTALAPDGTWMASLFPDRVAVHGLPDARLRFEHGSPHSYPVRILADATSKFLVIAGSAGDVAILDAVTGTPSATWRAHDGPIHDAALRPGGRSLVTAAADGAIRLWELPSGTAATEFEGHSLEVIDLAFHPTDDRLLSSSRDGSVRLWDLDQKTPLQSFAPHAHAVDSAHYLPALGRWLTTEEDRPDGLRLWDADSGRRIADLRELPLRPPAAFRSDIPPAPGTRRDNDTVTPKLAEWRVVSDGTRLILGSTGTSLIPAPPTAPPEPHAPLSLQGGADYRGHSVTPRHRRRPVHQLWDLRTGEPITRLADLSLSWLIPTDRAVSPDLELVVRGTAAHPTPAVRERSTGRLLWLLDPGARSFRFSQDGRHLWVSGRDEAVQHDARSGTPLQRIAYPASPERLSSDGSRELLRSTYGYHIRPVSPLECALRHSPRRLNDPERRRHGLLETRTKSAVIRQVETWLHAHGEAGAATRIAADTTLDATLRQTANDFLERSRKRVSDHRGFDDQGLLPADARAVLPLVDDPHIRGRLLHRLGRYEQAVEELRRATNPSHLHLGLALWHLGERTEASQQLRIGLDRREQPRFRAQPAWVDALTELRALVGPKRLAAWRSDPITRVARLVTEDAFRTCGSRSDALQWIRDRADLSVEQRGMATEFATVFEYGPSDTDRDCQMYAQAWAAVTLSTISPAMLRDATQAVIRRSPSPFYDVAALLGVEGAAHYQLGDLPSALERLIRAAELNDDGCPANAAFRAMAQHAAGTLDAARISLERAETLLAEPHNAGSDIFRDVVAEARRALSR